MSLSLHNKLFWDDFVLSMFKHKPNRKHQTLLYRMTMYTSMKLVHIAWDSLFVKMMNIAGSLAACCTITHQHWFNYVVGLAYLTCTCVKVYSIQFRYLLNILQSLLKKQDKPWVQVCCVQNMQSSAGWELHRNSYNKHFSVPSAVSLH